jgi:hypothetical protein
LQIKTKIISSHIADSKPVKQEVKGTVILHPLVFPGLSLMKASFTLAKFAGETASDSDMSQPPWAAGHKIEMILSVSCRQSGQGKYNSDCHMSLLLALLP